MVAFRRGRETESKCFGAQGAVPGQVAQRWRGTALEHRGAPCRNRGSVRGAQSLASHLDVCLSLSLLMVLYGSLSNIPGHVLQPLAAALFCDSGFVPSCTSPTVLSWSWELRWWAPRGSACAVHRFCLAHGGFFPCASRGSGCELTLVGVDLWKPWRLSSGEDFLWLILRAGKCYPPGTISASFQGPWHIRDPKGQLPSYSANLRARHPEQTSPPSSTSAHCSCPDFY